MDKEPDIPDFDPRAFNSIMKMGGKKKLDALTALFAESAPARLRELVAAQDLGEARAAAQALKNGAGNLGLGRLEDLCDQVLNAKSWPAAPGLVAAMEQAYRRGQTALQAERARI
jgi:HPt (histidine-containing phosphotransfer) domain-containing protein